MTILLTAFTPWGDLTENPTRRVTEALDGTFSRGRRVVTAVLPVSFVRAPRALEGLLETHRPAVLLSLGLAASRSKLSLERYGHNFAHAASDLDGEYPAGPLIPDGPEVLTAPWPVDALVEGLNGRGLPAEVSEDAGGYLCNSVYYHALYWRSIGRFPLELVGFLHIPWLEESPIEDRLKAPESSRSLPLATVVEGVRHLLERL